MRWWTGLFAVFVAGGARAQEADEKPVAPSDAHARPGAPIAYEAPPTEKGPKACSFRTPICVHYAKSTRAVPSILAAAERAWETLSGPLGVPSPDPDPETLSYDLWLRGDALAATHLSARDVRSRVDRARTFVTIDPNARPGCALDAAVTHAITNAFIARHNPAMDEGTMRAQSAALTNLIVPCATAFTVDDAFAFQSRPERAAAEGAAVFWSRIDWAYARTPGGIVTATWSLSPSMTESTTTWRDEPDTFDVLRVTFKNALHSGSTIDDLLLDTAIARAFMGANDDGSHAPETATLGDLGKVPLDWDIPWPEKPRRLTQKNAVSPTGASYVMIKASPGKRLRAEIAWEEHALFRWAFVKIDAAGRELGRVVIPNRERATETAMTLVEIGNADRIMLVGVNVGDPAYRFDPDDEVWEPHGWLLTIASVED